MIKFIALAISEREEKFEMEIEEFLRLLKLGIPERGFFMSRIRELECTENEQLIILKQLDYNMFKNILPLAETYLLELRR